MFNLPNPKFFLGKELPYLRYVAAFATSRPHLSDKFHKIEASKLLYVCDFFCGHEICKKVLNTLEILDFIYKERVFSDQAHSP